MSKIEDYLWLAINAKDVVDMNTENKTYVIIHNNKVLGFSNDYQKAFETFGDNVGIFNVPKV